MDFLKRLNDAPRALNFDSFVLRPRLSAVDPEMVNLETSLGPLKLSIPLIAAAMETTSSARLSIAVAEVGGVAIIPKWNLKKRLLVIREVKNQIPKNQGAAIDKNGKPIIAVTLSENEQDTVKQLINAGADILVVDTACGSRNDFIKALASIKKDAKAVNKDIVLVAGNVATADAASKLLSVGVDVLKVGLGVGSICTTTETTAVGIPQAAAIAEIADAVAGSGVGILAEGGMLSSGDIVKALACGASAVSLGNLFARSSEAAGKIKNNEDGQKMRQYSANLYPSMCYADELGTVVCEGIQGYVPVIGPAKRIVKQLIIGIKTGMGFVGARSIPELQNVAEFVQVPIRRPFGIYKPVPLEARERMVRRVKSSSSGQNQFQLFSEKDSVEIGVAIVVWENQSRKRLLIGKRPEGVFAVPGGHWGQGEPLIQSARREVEEETGIQCSDLTLASVHEFFNKKKGSWFVTVGFEGINNGGYLRVDSNGSLTDLQWVAPEEALRFEPIFPTDRTFIKHVIDKTVYG